jgi:hypothetical protein
LYSPALDGEVELSDGRALGYASWGDPEGADVLCSTVLRSARCVRSYAEGGE